MKAAQKVQKELDAKQNKTIRVAIAFDPTSGHLFVFTNRSADRVKVLYWGGHGLCLWCTRLEAGRYHFPEATAAGIELTDRLTD